MEKKQKGVRLKRSPAAMIYRLKIKLNEIEPSIWRRFEVPANITLIQLHHIIQSVMGWTNSHLHQFIIDGSYYTYPDTDMNPKDIDERTVRLNKVVRETGLTFQYDYDFGDGWEHQIEVEAIEPARPKIKYPRCLEGSRCCPPEDCGGPGGYEDFLKALADPGHEQHEELKEWIGGFWNPERFDLRDTNIWIREVSREKYYLKNLLAADM
ncbi:MAG: plasmid pRiA4b ORF-3 family protein [Candidatus Zixiibacteriota bacterium]